MKKPLSVILAILLLLVPTISATILYFLPDAPDHVEEEKLGGTLTISRGESYFFNESENSFLNDFFESLDENSSQTELSVKDLSFEKQFSVNVKTEAEERSISLYFSLNGNCYWAENEAVYLIGAEHSDLFLNSKYAKAIYQYSQLPTLATESKQGVLPSRAQWTYTLKNGSHAEGSYPALAAEPITYYSSSITGISFSIAPDECSVRAYVGERKVYDGSLDGLSSSGLENEPMVKYEILARWNSGFDAEFFGEAEYSFYLQQSKSAVFSIDRSEIMQGDFITVKAENVTDTSKLDCSFSSTVNFTPVFFQSGNNAYALIPFGAELEAGVYTVTLYYDGAPSSFDVTVNERPQIEQLDDSDVGSKLTDSAIRNMNSLISSVTHEYSDTSYASGIFYNYEKDTSFTIRLGFNHLRTFSNGKSITLEGVDFYCPSGENIPAMNNGIVCAVGEDKLLGKYVVVEHGYGLKTWYCHVGEIIVSQGDSVIKGSTIARSGISGLASGSGFYLISTVFDKPISPYALYETEFILPK